MKELTYRLLRDAILAKRQVMAYYHGHRREFCPHVLGTTKGKARCLVFQFGGAGASDDLLGKSGGDWRCFDVASLTDLEVREGEWFSSPRHLGHQSCVEIVDVALALARNDPPLLTKNDPGLEQVFSAGGE